MDPFWGIVYETEGRKEHTDVLIRSLKRDSQLTLKQPKNILAAIRVSASESTIARGLIMIEFTVKKVHHLVSITNSPKNLLKRKP